MQNDLPKYQSIAIWVIYMCLHLKIVVLECAKMAISITTTITTAHQFYKNGTSHMNLLVWNGCVFSMTDEELDEHA